MLTSRKQTSSYQDKVIKELEAAPGAICKEWGPFETEMLKRYYGKKDPTAIAKALGRSTQAVYNRAKILGLVRRNI